MILHDETTWPQDVKDFLQNKGQPLLDRELMMIDQPNSYNGYEYDSAHNAFTAILINHVMENAFHCTRLTEDEIGEIKDHGMQLPNLQKLKDRVQRLKETEVITENIGGKLIANNEADGEYRKEMLHFVFQSPHFEGHGGIGRFFSSWGGEALYNSHEEDPETGPILGNIGTPCIIQANIPISDLAKNFLVNKMVRIYYKKRGLKTVEPTRHEDYTKKPIPAENIVAIYRYPEKQFLKLSGCEKWRTEHQID